MIDNIMAAISGTTVGITTLIYYYISFKKIEAKYRNEIMQDFCIDYFDTAEEIDLEKLRIYSKIDDYVRCD